MGQVFSGKVILLIITFLCLGLLELYPQNNKEEEYLGKADMYKAKRNALEYLSDPAVVRKYGLISDSIWNFAELGMQEFRSSALLIKTLEDEGFNVEKGVAGMPTC